MKIVCIGHAAYDITFPVESFPTENTKNRVDKKIECGGGPASNAAYLLGKWNMDVAFVGIVGNDLYGRKIKSEFESVNVDTSNLLLSDNYETTSSIIVANTSVGSRTILTYRPNLMQMPKIDLNYEPDIIFVDGQEYDLSVDLINRYPNAISIIDAGRFNEENVKLSKLVDYVVCSKNFAEDFTKTKIDYNDKTTIDSLYSKLESSFKGNIVVTLESKGALYKFENQVKIMPSLKVNPIDSTGAGDIFHGAFTYGIANKMDYEEIIKFSNVAGALSTTVLGGRNSVFKLEEVRKVYNEFK